jgi:hypothetical protein
VWFYVLVFILTFPRAFTSTGGIRWAWLALGVLSIVTGGRGMLLGRVTGDRSVLTVWTAFRRHHFHRAEVVELRADRVRAGLMALTREALVVELSTGSVVLKDINVGVGSGGLDGLCTKVNDWLLVQADA